MPTRRSLHLGNRIGGRLTDELLPVPTSAAGGCALDAADARRADFAWHEAQHRSFSRLVELFSFLTMSGYHVENAT